MDFEVRVSTGLRTTQFPLELVIRHTTCSDVVGITLADLEKLKAAIQVCEDNDYWVTDEYGREIDTR